MKQFEKVFEHTSTDYAPWYIIPSSKKKYRDQVISEIVKNTLKAMNPQYPVNEDDLSKVVIDEFRIKREID